MTLAYDGPCRGGQVGAAYVRWPDGHRSVLTWRGPGDLGTVTEVEELLGIARSAGIPAPHYELVQELPCGFAIVQELLPGTPPTELSTETIESLVELNRRCRDLLRDRDTPPPALHLTSDGPGFCLHEPLVHYDERTARLHHRIHDLAAQLPPTLVGEDLVHFDFHAGNVLVTADGSLCGLVDWDGATRAHGHLDLVTLRFDLARHAPGLGRSLDPVLATDATPEIAAACWAHMSLRLVDWAIRHHGPSDVTAWLDISDRLCPL
ncbi:phosphotransferase [Nocardia transvalensis]|nr:phosphotransferase [Nocardia transvalensis]